MCVCVCACVRACVRACVCVHLMAECIWLSRINSVRACVCNMSRCDMFAIYFIFYTCIKDLSPV